MPNYGYYPSPYSGAQVDSAVDIALKIKSGTLVSSGGSAVMAAPSGVFINGNKLATEAYVSGAVVSGGGLDSGAVLNTVSGAGYTTSGAVIPIVSSAHYATSQAVSTIVSELLPSGGGSIDADGVRQIISSGGYTITGGVVTTYPLQVSGGVCYNINSGGYIASVGLATPSGWSGGAVESDAFQDPSVYGALEYTQAAGAPTMSAGYVFNPLGTVINATPRWYSFNWGDLFSEFTSDARQLTMSSAFVGPVLSVTYSDVYEALGGYGDEYYNRYYNGVFIISRINAGVVEGVFSGYVSDQYGHSGDENYSSGSTSGTVSYGGGTGPFDAALYPYGSSINYIVPYAGSFTNSGGELYLYYSGTGYVGYIDSTHVTPESPDFALAGASSYTDNWYPGEMGISASYALSVAGRLAGSSSFSDLKRMLDSAGNTGNNAGYTPLTFSMGGVPFGPGAILLEVGAAVKDRSGATYLDPPTPVGDSSDSKSILLNYSGISLNTIAGGISIPSRDNALTIECSDAVSVRGSSVVLSGSSGGVRLVGSAVTINGSKALAQLSTVVTSGATISASVLSGGTSYVYAANTPVTAISFTSITSDCRAQFKFTAGSSVNIAFPASCGFVGVSSPEFGSSYILAINQQDIVCVPYTETV